MSCNKIARVISSVIYVTLTLIAVTKSENCDPVCSWLQWGSWNSCSVSCGGSGVRNRTKELCCPLEDADFDTCVINCGFSPNDSFENESCGNSCYNNGALKDIGYGCDCKERSFGHCCEERDALCFPCKWSSWTSWSQCSVSCGGRGTRDRSRTLCCLPSQDFESCVSFCEVSRNSWYGSGSCGNICFNNGVLKNSGYGCHCKQRFFGHCCKDILPGCTPFPTDVIFILDSSASQTERQFQTQLDFVDKFVNNVNVSEEEFQIAVITFSTQAHVEIEFGQYSNKDVLRQAIMDIKFRPGATFTDKGLEIAMDLDRKSERRKGMVTLTYAFVLTDGMSNNRKETRAAATRLKNTGAHLIAIGIGQEVSHQELKDIASPGDSFSPSYVFSVGDFNALDTLLKQLVQITCNDCSEVSHLSDILFLLDESSPMTEEEFQLSIDVMTSVVQSTNHIGESNGQRVAVVQLTNKIDTVIQFSDEELQNQNDLQISFQRLHRSRSDMCFKDESCSPINITSAIASIYEDLFKQNGRQNSRKFLLILSNGRFQDPVAVKSEIEEINSYSDVKIFAIGPGLDVDIDGLLLLVKEANHVYVTLDRNDLEKLDILQSEFTYNVCTKT